MEPLVSANVISLDGWTLAIHSSQAGRSYHAKSSRCARVCIGAVSFQELEALMGDLKSPGVQPSGVHGKRTSNPGQIYDVVSSAIKKRKGTTFTFVFNKVLTDIEERSTTWDCARWALRNATSSLGEHNFNTAMAKFVFSLLSRQVQLLDADIITTKLINVIVVMLKKAVSSIVVLAEEGHDVSELFDGTRRARDDIHRICHAAATTKQRLYSLHEMCVSTVQANGFQVSAPFINEKQSVTMGTNFAAIRKSAYENLHIHELLQMSSIEVGAMYAWFHKHSQTNRKLPSHGRSRIILHTVELFMFERMRTATPTTLDRAGILAMEKLVDAYRIEASHFLNTKDARAMMIERCRSRELLVVWIAFCVIHRSMTELQPFLAKYSVSLRPEDLQFLVLAEKSAIEACMNVATYLRAWGTKPMPAVFSLRCGDATFSLATEVYDNSADLGCWWDKERREAKERQEKRWKCICEQQRRAQQLREEITQVQLEIRDSEAEACRIHGQITTNKLTLYGELGYTIRTLESDLKQLREKRHDLEVYSPERSRSEISARITANEDKLRPLKTEERTLTSEKRTLQSQLTRQEGVTASLTRTKKNKEADLKAAEKSPPPIFQPLPRDQELAKKVLFFLHMPEEWRILSRVTFTCQQMLIAGDAQVQSFEALTGTSLL